MYLTESERINGTQDLFLETIIDVMGDMYDMSGDYVMTEEDDYITSIIMDYFVEHYKQPTMRDSVTESLTGYNINQELVNEIVEMMLDESIGTFVAGAAHGLNTMFSKHKANRAEKGLAGANKAHDKVYDKMRTAQKAAKTSTGLSGTFQKAKAGALEKRRATASDKRDTAYGASQAATGAHSVAQTKRSNLAHKIDTGVSNIKNKVAGFAGKIAGKFA